ncbi:MAG: DNA-directed RNA polymerase subunit omega [Candidatus Aminicenantes bacterium]|nr:DNA-directed RNA polymerase subunit omega [Candidatus Aminicenantes bacterium]
METPGFVDSKFRLAILAAKRAMQLVGGSKKRVNIDAENPLTIALEEIYQGKVSFQVFDEEQMLLTQDQEEAALEKLEEELLGSFKDMDDDDDLEDDDTEEENQEQPEVEEEEVEKEVEVENDDDQDKNDDDKNDDDDDDEDEDGEDD